jgi:hypothetical protein
MKLDRIQIANILNVKLKGLETIECRNQLKERLKEVGYSFIKKIKEGRNSYYIVKKNKISKDRKLYNDICKYAYNTNKPNQFGMFFNIRTENNNAPISNSELSSLININVNTLTKWNDCLLDKGIIAKDGFFHFYISSNKKIGQCSEEEFNTF